MRNIRVVVLFVVCIATIFYAARVVKNVVRDRENFKQHEALIAETNECLAAGEWNCAEKNLLLLLEKTPQDTNLQLHLAGIYFEQDRYEECIHYIDSLGYTDKDFDYLKKKSQALLHEMSELQIKTSGHFRLELEGHPARNDILEALSVLEVAYDSLCRLFDFRPENKMRLVLYQSSEYGGVGPRPDWVGAVYDGKLRIPVNVMQNQEVYRPMLFHELTHAFVRAMTRAKVPLWLNEGIAQVIDASRNDEEKPAGGKPDLKMLTDPFVNQEKTDVAVKLYWYSQKMVEGLLYRNGAARGDSLAVKEIQKLRLCLQDLYALGVDGALQKHYGLTSAQLLDEVR